MSPRWDPDPDVRRGRSAIHHHHAHLVFAGSCGGAPLSIIKEYIEQQKRPD